MNTLTIGIEVLLGIVGATVAVGAPLVDVYLHHRDQSLTPGPALVRIGRLSEDRGHADDRELVPV